MHSIAERLAVSCSLSLKQRLQSVSYHCDESWEKVPLSAIWVRLKYIIVGQASGRAVSQLLPAKHWEPSIFTEKLLKDITSLTCLLTPFRSAQSKACEPSLSSSRMITIWNNAICSAQRRSSCRAEIRLVSPRASKHINSKSNLSISWFPRHYFSLTISLSLSSIILALMTHKVQFPTSEAMFWFGCTRLNCFSVSSCTWHVQWSIHGTCKGCGTRFCLPLSARSEKKVIDFAKILTNGRADANGKKKKSSLSYVF